MRTRLGELLERWRMAFCRRFHRHISRPLGDYYLCFDCHRRWPVPWGRP